MRFQILLKRFTPITLVLVMLSAIGLSAESAVAQCFPNPTGETAVGLRNASSHFLIFYIDDIDVGGVPPGDRSVDFVVSAGEHYLRADAVINGETVSASRKALISLGYVCTWTVTDPPRISVRGFRPFRDSLRREASIPIVVPD